MLSFQYGKPVSNQKLETWWPILEKDTFQAWINYFKDTEESVVYDDNHIIHVETLSLFLCLDMKKYCNHYKIRKSHGTERPDGQAELMYCLCELLLW